MRQLACRWPSSAAEIQWRPRRPGHAYINGAILTSLSVRRENIIRWANGVNRGSRWHSVWSTVSALSSLTNQRDHKPGVSSKLYLYVLFFFKRLQAWWCVSLSVDITTQLAICDVFGIEGLFLMFKWCVCLTHTVKWRFVRLSYFQSGLVWEKKTTTILKSNNNS